MGFSKGNHGHGLDEKCVEEKIYGLQFQVLFKAIHYKLRSRRLILYSWWLFVHCFLVKSNPTRIIVLLEENQKIRNALFVLVKKAVKTPTISFLPGHEKSS